MLLGRSRRSRFPSVLLQPLGHLSVEWNQQFTASALRRPNRLRSDCEVTACFTARSPSRPVEGAKNPGMSRPRRCARGAFTAEHSKTSATTRWEICRFAMAFSCGRERVPGAWEDANANKPTPPLFLSSRGGPPPRGKLLRRRVTRIRLAHGLQLAEEVAAAMARLMPHQVGRVTASLEVRSLGRQNGVAAGWNARCGAGFHAACRSYR